MVRIAPPSADLLIKLAMLGIGIGVAVYAVRRVTNAVQGAVSAAWAPFDAAADAAAQWVRSGTRYVNEAADWAYNEIHFENHPEYNFIGPPNPYESGNNGDYTSILPPITGSGGAAFGMYPRANTGGASGSW